MVSAQPFRPFLVNLADGRMFAVRNPELASCSMNGRELVVHDDDGMHLVEMLMVIELVAAPEGARHQRPDGGARGRRNEFVPCPMNSAFRQNTR